MFLIDAIRISGKNIKIHFKRSLMVTVVMGVIFGLVFTMNLFLRGIKNSYMNFANTTADDKIIILATNDSAEVSVYNETVVEVADRASMVYDIEKYGGRIIGDTERFGMFGTIIMPEELTKDLIEIDPNSGPRGAAPVLVNTFLGEQLLGNNLSTELDDMDKKVTSYEKYRSGILGKTFEDANGAEYYVVGLAPGSYHVNNLSFRQIQANNNNLLNPLLERIPVVSGMSMVVDDEEDEEWQKEYITSDTDFGIVSVVAVFDNSTDAYEYFVNGDGAFPNVTTADKTYFVSVISGVSPEINFAFNWFGVVVNAICVILCIIAGIVVIFTSIRLVDQDKQNVALYYSLGATNGQVKVIYLFYFAELMVGALAFAFALASVVLIAFNLFEKELLSALMMLGFSLSEHPQIVWYGLNLEVFIGALIMLGLAPLCVLINNRRLCR